MPLSSASFGAHPSSITDPSWSRLLQNDSSGSDLSANAFVNLLKLLAKLEWHFQQVNVPNPVNRKRISAIFWNLISLLAMMNVLRQILVKAVNFTKNVQNLSSCCKSCQGWIYSDGCPVEVWLVETHKPTSIFPLESDTSKQKGGFLDDGDPNWWGHMCRSTVRPCLNSAMLRCTNYDFLKNKIDLVWFYLK